jgi:hypothetical protein
MCVIVYKPMSEKPISKEWLQNAVENNPDGWGVLARDADGTIVVHQGFDDKRFLELGNQYGEGFDVVVHARIATSGRVDMHNLHPFPIYEKVLEKTDLRELGEPVAWLFHNGMVKVPEWNKDRSDTWHLARIMEASYGGQMPDKMRQRGWRRRQKKRLGTYNKFVLVSKGGVNIINPNAGLWEQGCWHSNKTALEENLTKYCGFGYSGQETSRLGAGWDTKLAREQVGAEGRKLFTSNGIWIEGDDGEWVLVPHDTAAEAAEVFNNAGEEYLPKGLDELQAMYEADEQNIQLGNKIREIGERKEREMRQHSIIEEWISNPSIDEIEETIYNYDAGTVSLGIQYLLDKIGVGPRANYKMAKEVM